MVLLHRKPADDDDGDNALDTPDTYGNTAAVDSICACLRLAELENLFEFSFIVVKLSRQKVCALGPAENGVSLSLCPQFVVGSDSRAGDALEQDLAAVGQGN